jgi:hypothetical protein
MPGESPAVFGDALRRLATAATYLYQDGNRYWYSTQPTVTKLAEDRAEQYQRNPDAVAEELEKRLRADLREMGDFRRVHPLPHPGQDVPDDLDARLVVLGPDHPYSKQAGNPAEVAAKAILASRGNAPRLFQNSLVFLAVDRTRLQDLDEAIRRFLAWESILLEKEELDLSPHQVKQAETQKASADVAVKGRLPEAYQWLLVPVQETPQKDLEWQAFRLSGQEPLAVRACKKLKNDELLVTALAGTRLRMELDRVPLWRSDGDHVEVAQLCQDFARYLYLPRLTGSSVLSRAVSDGVSLLTWEQDTFAYADSYDEEEARYRGLRCGQHVAIPDRDASGLLVEPSAARLQLDEEAPTPKPAGETGTTTGGDGVEPTPPGGEGETPEDLRAKRFHGSVELDAARVGRDASRIAEEVISHLAGLVGATLKVTLEIEAEIPKGVPEHVVRTVTENSRTLKFSSQGFEED